MFILASNSPRRKELLALTGWSFVIQPADVDETPLAGELPLDYVRRVAREKLRRVKADAATEIIIAADTIVVDGNEILGKPASETDAFRILKQLRGRRHTVHTALSVLQSKTWRTKDDLCTSLVEMRNYSDQEIGQYILSGDPMDKAGAYAVQNREFKPVVNFTECFANVMGLPLCHLQRTMAKLDFLPLNDIPDACQRHLKYDCPIHRDVLLWRKNSRDGGN